MEKPFGARSKIEKTADAININIPARKSPLIAVLMVVWLIVWISGGGWIIISVVNSFSILMLIVLLLWTGGGLLVAKRLIWELIGEQIIVVNKAHIVLEKRMLNQRKSKRFELSMVENLRLTPTPEEDDETEGDNSDELIEPDDIFDEGILEFKYQNSVVNFAADIDEAEAKFLLDLFKEWGVNTT